MIPSSLAYQREMLKNARGMTHIRLEYGVKSDVKITEIGINVGSVFYPSTNKLINIYKNNYPSVAYAYLGKNAMKTNGKQKILPRNNKNKNQDCGIISNIFSTNTYGENGYLLEKDLVFTLVLEKEPKDINGFVLKFDKSTNLYYSKIKIIVKSNEKIIYNECILNNDIDFVFDLELKAVTSIEIHCLECNVARTTPRITNVYIGVNAIFTEDDISDKGLKYTRNISLLSNQLSYGEMSFTVNNIDGKFNPLNPSGIFKNFRKTQPITLEFGQEINDGNDIEWIKVASLLTDKIEFDETTFTIRCIDLLNTLNQISYYTKYNEKAIQNTWWNMLDEICYNSKDSIAISNIIVPDNLKNENATSQGFPVSIKEMFQLIANTNSQLVETNKDGKIEFKDAWIPNVELVDNGHLPFSNLNNAFDSNQLPLFNYAQLTKGFMKVKLDNNLIIPSLDKTKLADTGYISEELCDENGIFSQPLQIDLNISLPTNIKNLYLVFDHINNDYATDFTVTYYGFNGKVLHEEIITDNTLVEVDKALDIKNCVKYSIIITKWKTPNHRAIINRIGSGRMLSYYLDFDTIMKKPNINLTNNIKDIAVKVHKYEKDGNDYKEIYQKTIYGNGKFTLTTDTSYWFTNIQKVSGTGTISNVYNAYSNAIHFTISDNTEGMVVKMLGIPQKDTTFTYIYNFNKQGQTIELDNPFVTNEELAEKLAYWYYDYIEKGQKFVVDYRGDITIEPFDFIYLESQFEKKIPVCVTKVELNYNGGLNGRLEVIRV